jgi:hypothetical protein
MTGDLRQLADALDTAYGCLDLVRQDIKPTDLDECIAEIEAARDKAWGWERVAGDEAE